MLTVLQLLEGIHQKVSNRLEAARNSKTAAGVDPLRTLPFELADMIFKYLPFETLMYAPVPMCDMGVDM